VLDSLVDLISGSPWTYGIVFLLAFLDVLIPIVPSETTVITAGVLAASGELNLVFVMLAAAAGACLGDNVAYFLGQSLEDFVQNRFFAGKKRRHLERAERMLAERGGYFIVIGRFIPGGRTAVTLGAGVLDYPWRRFIGYDVAAALLWATYGGLLGYFGGKAFEDDPLKGIILALGIAFGIAGAVELYRWRKVRKSRQQRPAPAQKPAPEEP
jgi:membrane protein DedA with SNARE-associated domain